MFHLHKHLNLDFPLLKPCELHQFTVTFIIPEDQDNSVLDLPTLYFMFQ